MAPAADINIGMEHGVFDLAGLEQFMQDLVDGGPTDSDHRAPAVIVEMPVEAVVLMSSGLTGGNFDRF